MGSKFISLSFLSVVGVGFMLTITLFLVNQQQDIRQQASTAVSTPTPTVEPEGCPDQNPDGRMNICRAEATCHAGEVEKENGRDECRQKTGKLAKCCTIVTAR